MTDRDFFVEMLTRFCPAGEGDMGEFWRVNKDDGSVTIIGEDLQEITFLFDESGELKWFK